MPNIGHLLTQIGAVALIWLPIMMFGMIIYLLWRTLQVMPRVKTKSAKHDLRVVGHVGRRRRRSRRRRTSCRRSSTSCATRSASRRSARACRRASCSTGRPAPARRSLAKAVASESGASFYSQSASAFVEMFAGLGAARIRKLFEEARKNAPAIVFIDELDAVGAARSGHGFNREQDQTLNQLLVELDGFGTRDQVVVMGASNRLQDLDPALLRPGPLRPADPRPAARPRGPRGDPRACTRAASRSRADVDLDGVARQTAGLTGADLANICNEAAIFAGRDERSERSTRSTSTTRWSASIAGLQQRRVDHREGEADPRLPRGRPRAHVAPDGRRASRCRRRRSSPRGQALGYTLNLPEEERYLHTKEELLDWMIVALAGRAAEQVVFGRVTNGAANDLEKVTELARAMVFEYGMGEGVAVAHDARRQLRALRGDEARCATSEQARLTDDAYAEARAAAREAPRRARPRRAGAAREGDARPRGDASALFGDVEPESQRERDRRPDRSAPADRRRPRRDEAPSADSILLACRRRGSTIWESPSRTSTRRSTRTSGSSAPRSSGRDTARVAGRRGRGRPAG